MLSSKFCRLYLRSYRNRVLPQTYENCALLNRFAPTSKSLTSFEIHRSAMSPPRHKTEEDELPPFKPGSIRLYGMQYCPFVMRARLMLARHGVDYELININLKRKPAWLFELSKDGTVPVLQSDRGLLRGALIVAEYVEGAFGTSETRSLSTDAFERAQTKMLIDDKFGKAMSALYMRVKKRDGWEEPVMEHIGELDKELESKKFFTGDKITFADYMIFPWLRMLSYAYVEILATGKLKNVERWLKDMEEDNTIKKCHTRPEILRKYLFPYATGDHEFDLE